MDWAVVQRVSLGAPSQAIPQQDLTVDLHGLEGLEVRSVPIPVDHPQEHLMSTSEHTA